MRRLHRWVGVTRVVLFMVSCANVLAAIAPMTPKLPSQWSQVALGAATSLAAFGLTALFARWDRIQLKDVGAAVSWPSLLRVAIGFLIGVILVGLQSSIVGLAGHVRWKRVGVLEFSGAGVALLAYLALACREELAFRGYPLRRLDWFLGPYAAQLLIALAFGAEHVAGGYTWTNALLGVSAGSLLFGMVALATRGLAVPIGLHTAWNFGQWAIGGKEVPGLWRPEIEHEFREQVERVGMISYLIVIALATFVFWCLYRRRAAAR